MNQTILLIEDETDVLLSNQELFMSVGYNVLMAESIREGWERLRDSVPDLIVLDIMLPDGLGLDFCGRIREIYTVPVLFLSCRNEQRHIIEGLRIGGDDYMTKPYSMDELLARCQAILRRVGSGVQKQPEMIQVSSLMLDILKQKAYLKGVDILLTPKEFALLLFFIKHPLTGFTSGELYEAVWGMPCNKDARTIKSHIYHLRRKLRMDISSEFSISMPDRRHYVWSTAAPLQA